MKIITYKENYNNSSNLNDNFYKWFSNSKVTDNSQPTICYHGSYKLSSQIANKNLKFNEYNDKDIGIHFGNFSQANTRVSDLKTIGKVNKSEESNIVEVYLKIENPLYLYDQRDWSKPDLLYHNLLDTGYFIHSELDKCRTSAKNVLWKWLFNLKNLIISKGYDGVFYINKYESNNRDMSYIVFKSNQIKSVDNDGSWDTNDDNIFS